MSLGKIIFLSMALGAVSGLLVNSLPGDAPASAFGAVIAFFAVIGAGMRQPLPKARRRR